MIEVDINDALVRRVQAAGGFKAVGKRLWPEKGNDTAQRALLDSLNPDRPAHLTPEQMLFVIKLARDEGCHEGMEALCSLLGYAPTTPIDAEDERAELQRQYILAAKTMGRIAQRIEELAAPVATGPRRAA